jgi:arylsulfatase A-like enzyme
MSCGPNGPPCSAPSSNSVATGRSSAKHPLFRIDLKRGYVLNLNFRVTSGGIPS